MKVLASYLIALATSVLFCTSKAYQVEPKLMETLMRLGKVDNETANTQINQEGTTEAAINPIDDDTTETTPSLSDITTSVKSTSTVTSTTTAPKTTTTTTTAPPNDAVITGGGGPCIDVPTLAYICSYLRNLCVKEAGGQLPENLYPWVQKTCKKTCGLC